MSCYYNNKHFRLSPVVIRGINIHKQKKLYKHMIRCKYEVKLTFHSTDASPCIYLTSENFIDIIYSILSMNLAYDKKKSSIDEIRICQDKRDTKIIKDGTITKVGEYEDFSILIYFTDIEQSCTDLKLAYVFPDFSILKESQISSSEQVEEVSQTSIASETPTTSSPTVLETSNDLEESRKKRKRLSPKSINNEDYNPLSLLLFKMLIGNVEDRSLDIMKSMKCLIYEKQQFINSVCSKPFFRKIEIISLFEYINSTSGIYIYQNKIIRPCIILTYKFYNFYTEILSQELFLKTGLEFYEKMKEQGLYSNENYELVYDLLCKLKNKDNIDSSLLFEDRGLKSSLTQPKPITQWDCEETLETSSSFEDEESNSKEDEESNSKEKEKDEPERREEVIIDDNLNNYNLFNLDILSDNYFEQNFDLNQMFMLEQNA